MQNRLPDTVLPPPALWTRACSSTRAIPTHPASSPRSNPALEHLEIGGYELLKRVASKAGERGHGLPLSRRSSRRSGRLPDEIAGSFDTASAAAPLRVSGSRPSATPLQRAPVRGRLRSCRWFTRTSFGLLAAALLCAGIAGAAPAASRPLAALTNYTQAKRSNIAMRVHRHPRLPRARSPALSPGSATRRHMHRRTSSSGAKGKCSSSCRSQATPGIQATGRRTVHCRRHRERGLHGRPHRVHERGVPLRRPALRR